MMMRRLKRHAALLGGILLTMWLIEFVDWVVFGGALDAYGIQPCTIAGLRGIALAPLLQEPHIVPAVQARMEQLIATLDAQIRDSEAEIAAALNQDAVWAAAATHLQTIPGVGSITAAWLLVTTLNFTIAQTPDELTAYAGLAPHPR